MSYGLATITTAYLSAAFVKHLYDQKQKQRLTETQNKLEHLRQALELGERVDYHKGEYKTRDLMPRVKGPEGYLGSGVFGCVSIHALYPDRVIKRSDRSKELENEWTIGRILSKNTECPHFPKFYGLAVKENQSQTKKTSRFMMERIYGQTVHKLWGTIEQREDILSLFEQAKLCCLYLHKKNICINDQHANNLMLDQTKSSPRLMMIDFGHWEIDPPHYTKASPDHLYESLRGAQRLASNIVQLYAPKISLTQLQYENVYDFYLTHLCSLEAEALAPAPQELNAWIIQRFFNTVKDEFQTSKQKK